MNWIREEFEGLIKRRPRRPRKQKENQTKWESKKAKRIRDREKRSHKETCSDWNTRGQVHTRRMSLEIINKINNFKTWDTDRKQIMEHLELVPF